MKRLELVVRLEDFLLDPNTVKMSLDQAFFRSEWIICEV